MSVCLFACVQGSSEKDNIVPEKVSVGNNITLFRMALKQYLFNLNLDEFDSWNAHVKL